ncbi:hypothetical protein H0A36_15810 [Endozoicomonas sp. SM1973]|uniref:Uncharacterized protein n=1 Tax=Spartinivicinus marinus TaxID=2994442 RepID=A0A853I256_9GAMM|nr:hypothetical protein [Spartinivicinus marinus]MCX4028406.1 hypothetical protein [Spartinivicinus marinus]NYZ67483.1 hypothetical protein [Spartinivicinus marinus]
MNSDVAEAKSHSITGHLNSLKNKGLVLSNEMGVLFNQEGSKLIRQCENYIKKIVVVVAILFVITVAWIFINLYGPIFWLGKIA